MENIEIVRKCIESRGETQKLIGAVAGRIVSDDVLLYAQKNGLYVIKHTGESASIADMPEGFTPRIW